MPNPARDLCVWADNPLSNHCQTVLLPWLAWCTLRDPSGAGGCWLGWAPQSTWGWPSSVWLGQQEWRGP